jgi:hypothetical protein
VTSHDVFLEWYDPPFSGVPPTHYKIYMRNDTRNFSEWSVVHYPGVIKRNHFQVRNLPMGVSCQFCIAAFNAAGRSELSAPSMYCMPGEEQQVLSEEIKWRRLQQGGALAILDRLALYPYDHNDHINGLRRLIAFGQSGQGYKNSRIALRVAEISLNCLQTYTKDPEMISLASTCIAWSLCGKGERKVRPYVLESGLSELISSLSTEFRSDSRVVNSLSFLIGRIPKFLPHLPEYECTTINPQPKKKDDISLNLEDDDEDEDDVGLEEEEEEEAEGKHNETNTLEDG